MDIQVVPATGKLGVSGDTFPQQKPMAGCETLSLLNLHRAVKFHYKTGQHGDCYLGQDIFNSILMVLSCRPAHQDIFHAAEVSGTGQMKICSRSYSKWALTATICQMLCGVGACSDGSGTDTVPLEFTLQPRR